MLAGDIRDGEGARRLVLGAVEQMGALDVLVNNAGGQFFSPAELISAKGWRAVWRLNVEGMLNMAEAAHELALAPAAAAARSSTSRSRRITACRAWRTRAPRARPSRR